MAKIILSISDTRTQEFNNRKTAILYCRALAELAKQLNAAVREVDKDSAVDVTIPLPVVDVDGMQIAVVDAKHVKDAWAQRQAEEAAADAQRIEDDAARAAAIAAQQAAEAAALRNLIRQVIIEELAANG